MSKSKIESIIEQIPVSFGVRLDENMQYAGEIMICPKCHGKNPHHRYNPAGYMEMCDGVKED